MSATGAVRPSSGSIDERSDDRSIRPAPREWRKQKQKVVQYLDEAHGTEMGLTRVLQSQIAMTPRGDYRSALEQHLQETRSHAERVQRRLGELDGGGNPLSAGLGVVESLVGQVLALSKTPFDLLRGSGGEEKVLENAKDACATEALEIATYTVLEHLARAVGDDKTVRLAASIRADEEKMLARVTRELRPLTAAVVGAEIEDDPSYDVTTTGAADAAKSTARTVNAKTRRTARQARKVPGVARVEGEIKGAVASAEDLAIARYDQLTAEEIAGRLPELSQIDLAKIDAYERRHDNRTTVLSRIGTLRGNEPWPGYDELGVQQIRIALAGADDDRTAQVRAYERNHKNRTGVLSAAERELATA